MAGPLEAIREREESEKAEVIDLVNKQMLAEGELVELYEKSVGEIKSQPVKHLLHMIQLDSRKHMDMCQVALEILRGEELLKTEKKELVEGLQRHIDLEKESIDRADKIMKNVWIEEIKGLHELFKRLKEDEKEHHRALMILTGKEFFRVSSRELVGIFQDLEERYEKYERKKR